MQSISRARRRTTSMFAIAVLLFALVLSSCAGRGAAHTTTPGGVGNTATQTSNSGASAALNADIGQLSATDSQIQSALSSADDAQNAADQDQSSQDNDTTP